MRFKQLNIFILAVVLFAGCSPQIKVESSQPEGTIAPIVEEVSTPAIELKGTKIPLGLSQTKLQKLLEQNSLAFEYVVYDEDHIADEMAFDVIDSAFLIESDSQKYQLELSNGMLTDIVWVESLGLDESEMPKSILRLIEEKKSLPDYIAFEYTDVFLFEESGGFRMQAHFKLEQLDGKNSVVNRLCLKNGVDNYPDSKLNNHAYLLGDFPETNGIGSEKARQLVMEKQGSGGDGVQNFTFDGLAMYDKTLYYSISWSQLVDDHSSYNGQFYVSMDGKKTLRGYHGEIL